MIVENNEVQMFNQFVLDQSKFYLSVEVIRKGVEACVRHFKPRMALVLASLSLNEEIKCADYANLMPDLNAKVTMKDVEETSMILRTLEKNWNREKFFSSVAHFYLKHLDIKGDAGLVLVLHHGALAGQGAAGRPVGEG